MLRDKDALTDFHILELYDIIHTWSIITGNRNKYDAVVKAFCYAVEIKNYKAAIYFYRRYIFLNKNMCFNYFGHYFRKSI